MKKAFTFSLPSTKGDQFDLKKIKENVVIYFYPKDDTPGCTLETKDFSKLYKEFKKNKTEVVGISKDSMTSHLKFKKKYKVPFQLLSDEDVKVQKKYKVWGMKSFMGRKFKGTIRSTFLVGWLMYTANLFAFAIPPRLEIDAFRLSMPAGNAIRCSF